MWSTTADRRSGHFFVFEIARLQMPQIQLSRSNTACRCCGFGRRCPERSASIARVCLHSLQSAEGPSAGRRVESFVPHTAHMRAERASCCCFRHSRQYVLLRWKSETGFVSPQSGQRFSPEPERSLWQSWHIQSGPSIGPRLLSVSPHLTHERVERSSSRRFPQSRHCVPTPLALLLLAGKSVSGFVSPQAGHHFSPLCASSLRHVPHGRAGASTLALVLSLSPHLGHERLGRASSCSFRHSGQGRGGA